MISAVDEHLCHGARSVRLEVRELPRQHRRHPHGAVSACRGRQQAGMARTQRRSPRRHRPGGGRRQPECAAER